MEWQVIVALIFAVSIILFPALFIWYLNLGGVYSALRRRGMLRIRETAVRMIRIALAIIAPMVIYAFVVWFAYGRFGWQVTLAVAIVFPIVLFIPALIWAAVVSGLYQVAFDRLRRRAINRRRTGRLVKEPVAVSEAVEGE
jgi:hypothetical protein